ncbi:MAG: 4Fe-4S dicluster domain-containing protein [Candidatus Atabeyarchaeum deiterrae]|jgi:2-oxoacid:acceptor oxidoreductase delta subunit (pyruvate/2-ketoisovalerate family)
MSTSKTTAKKIPVSVVAKPGSTRANKTGSWRTKHPVCDKNKCTACTLCVLYCPEGVIKVDKKNKFEVDLDYCKGCGICVEVCPVKALEMKPEKR